MHAGSPSTWVNLLSVTSNHRSSLPDIWTLTLPDIWTRVFRITWLQEHNETFQDHTHPHGPTCLWPVVWADGTGRRVQSWPCLSQRRRWESRPLSSCTALSSHWTPPGRLCPALVEVEGHKRINGLKGAPVPFVQCLITPSTHMIQHKSQYYLVKYINWPSSKYSYYRCVYCCCFSLLHINFENNSFFVWSPPPTHFHNP